MTRDQFLALAGQLYDAQTGGGGTGDGRAPKYDTAIHVGQGKVVYASECSLKELNYYLKRAEKPPSDPKYLESNEKRAKALRYFVAYRQASPTEQWRGERNRTTVLATIPSDRPEQYDKDAPTQSAAPSGSGDIDDIPFMRKGTEE